MEQFNEESNIINEIRKLCYKNGKEKYPKQSAKLFHKLGNIYAKKTDKTSLIQSAALINAALVRNPENTKTIQNDLKNFCKKVLSDSNSNTDVCLVEIANTFKQKLNSMREDVSKDVSGITPFPNWATWAEERELLPLEQEKVAVMKTIQAKVANSYKQIMSDLARTVEDIMKDLPCRYALVGMGSLAREEVTPYSDFESILVLEEGVQNNNNYDITLEYFRWYAVIFQLILINLGETLIPSVAIPTLNDFTSANGGWFYDAFTPSGVCFDGMMPHAYKSPLGRQETEGRPWKTELIKPVSEMVKYLDIEEDLKNGYHLAELLSKICFVSGNKSVYDNFNRAVANQLRENEKNELYFDNIKQTVMKDQQKFDMQFNMSQVYFFGQIDVKNTVYRSITIFVSALGRICDTPASSCFDIIEELQNKSLISLEEKHKLQYAVAVACELRLKVYMKEKQQRNILQDVRNALSVADFVGLRSTVDACVTADYLQKYVVQLCDLKSSYRDPDATLSLFKKITWKCENVLRLTIMHSLNCHNECITLANQCIAYTSMHDITYNLDSYNLLLHAYINCAMSLFELNQPLESLCMLEHMQTFLSSQVTTHTLDMDRFELCHGMLNYEQRLEQFVSYYSGIIYFDLQMYDDALRCFERKVPEIGEQISIDESVTNFYLFFDIRKAVCLIKMKRLDKAVQLLKETHILASREEGGIPRFHQRRIAIRCTLHLGKCFYKLQNYEEALIKFEQTLDFYQRASLAEESDFDVALSKHCIGKCYYKTNKHHRAMEFFKAVSVILKLNSVNSITQRLAEKNCYFCGRTLFKLKRYGEALEYFRIECEI